MTLDHWNFIITALALVLAVGIAAYSWRRARSLSIAILVWFALALLASLNGFFHSTDGWSDGDLVGFFIFGTLMTIPLLVFLVAWRWSPAFAGFLKSLPLTALTGIEAYRVGGAIFFWMYTRELMPPQMGIFTGFADVFIGLTALPLAWGLARGLRGSRQLAIAWNLFGIGDFAVAISMVSLSIFGLLALEPAPVMIGLHPLALIALFQLPLSIAIHILALRQLFSQERTNTWLQSSSSVHPEASAW